MIGAAKLDSTARFIGADLLTSEIRKFPDGEIPHFHENSQSAALRGAQNDSARGMSEGAEREEPKATHPM
jgi:hypothetical protein